MDLGAFSISLAVKDIQASKAFYENLGFNVFAGNTEQKFLILKNGPHVIGLFEGMFDKNILTFNPGWDQDGNTVEGFTDIREIKKELKTKGLDIQQDVEGDKKGPASFVLVDPDGNPVLIDQHV